jgi:hypothetical protein
MTSASNPKASIARCTNSVVAISFTKLSCASSLGPCDRLSATDFGLRRVVLRALGTVVLLVRLRGGCDLFAFFLAEVEFFFLMTLVFVALLRLKGADDRAGLRFLPLSSSSSSSDEDEEDDEEEPDDELFSDVRAVALASCLYCEVGTWEDGQ